MLYEIKAPQFYTDLGLQISGESSCKWKIQGLFKAFECFPVLFNTNFIFKDFSRQSCISKYFSSLCEPWIHRLVCIFVDGKKQSQVFSRWDPRVYRTIGPGEHGLASQPLPSKGNDDSEE